MPPIQPLNQIGDISMMTRNWPIACAIAVALIVFPTIAHADLLTDLNQYVSPAPTQPMPYGTGNGLTTTQSNILRRGELKFPQSYRAMISKLGYPDARDAKADYYDLDDRRRVAVVYSGSSAVAVEGI
jgi:hypothetical protein